MCFMDGEVRPIDDQTRILSTTKGVANRRFSSWQRGGGRRWIGLAIHPRRTPTIRRGDEVALVITMTIQTVTVNRDLDVDSSPGCVTNGDPARRNGCSWHCCRHDNSSWATRNGCRNDVTFVITMTIQTTSIDRDVDEETSRSCVTNSYLASRDGRRR